MSVVSLPDEGAVKRMDPLLKMAVVNNICAVVEASIRKDIDLNARDDRGATALMLAAARGHGAICRLLLDAGADPGIRDRDGRDAADHAILSKRTDAYLVIAEARAKQRPSHLSPPAVSGLHPSPEVRDAPGNAAPVRTAVQEVHLSRDNVELRSEGDQILEILPSWEADAEPARPEQDPSALRSAATDNLRISLHRPLMDAEDWSGVPLSLPPAPGRTQDARDTVLEPLLRRRLGSILLQGMRTGLVHPSRISAAATGYPEPTLLKTALTTTLTDMGVKVDHAYPDLWSPIGTSAPDERQAARQGLAAIELHVAEGTDEIARLRAELDRWTLLSRADEMVYGRQIREGLQGALSIAARSESVLTRIIHACEDAIEGRLPAGDLLDLDEDESWDPENEGDVTGVEGGDSDPGLPEHLRTLSVNLRSLRAAFAEMKQTGGPGCDPILARGTARLLDACGFSTAFLRTLSMLEPAGLHDARLMDEYRAALERMDHARECMIISNMKLVIWQARKYRPGSMTLADLVQEGAIGLMRAVSKFDPFRGFRFATYALWWIRQSIMRAMADKDRLVRLPVHVLEHHRRIQRRLSRGESFESLTGESIAADLAISPRLAGQLLDVFFDAECTGGLDELAELTPPAGDGDPQEHLEAKELRREIALLLGELNPRQRDVMNRRFGLIDGNDQTLEEIGQLYGVTRERIRQIEAKALAQLAHPVRAHRLAVFLR